MTLKTQGSAVLQKAIAAGLSTHVVSVNWSRDVILGALHGVVGLKPSQVWSNSLEEVSGLTTGRLDRYSYEPTLLHYPAKQDPGLMQPLESTISMCSYAIFTLTFT